MGKEIHIKKLKLLYLLKILFEETDDDHHLSREEIEQKLADYGIKEERKTIYDDINCLRKFGYSIETIQSGKQIKYYISSRYFELPELKLLVDAVQASRFITTKKTNNLIEKIENLTSKFERNKLQRQVYVANRIKNANEKIYYVVDEIHNAINSDSQIIFKYFEWCPDGNRKYKHEGTEYHVSPWAMLWDNQNYYLIAFNEDLGEMRHYRVDKVDSVNIISKKRNGKDFFDKYDITTYSQSMFGMFGGKLQKVQIKVGNEHIGVFYDRFGTDIVLERNEGFLIVEVLVNVSEHFLGWILAIGNDIKVISPQETVDMVKNMLAERMNIYGE